MRWKDCAGTKGDVMKDKNGDNVKVGDLMAHHGGDCYMGGVHYLSFRLWEVPKIQDGHGLRYNWKGEKHTYAWAWVHTSVKIDIRKLPEGFYYSFKHGMSDIDIEEKYMSTNINDAIEKSDWEDRNMSKERIENLIKISKISITSFRDIYEKWDDIFSGKDVCYEVTSQIFKLFGYKRQPAINGEIGIAMMNDHIVFMGIVETLKKWKDDGTLEEKCREYDSTVAPGIRSEE